MIYNKGNWRGTWEAQSTLDHRSGLDLNVMNSTLSVEPTLKKGGGERGNWKCNLNNIALHFSECILITKKVFNFFIVEDRFSTSLCKVKKWYLSI